MKRFLIALLILSTGLLVAISGCKPESRTQSSPLPTSTPVPAPTPVALPNGWYLYTDKSAGYSFSYPPTSHLNTSQEGSRPFKTMRLVFNAPDTHGYQGMVIDVLPNSEQTPIAHIVTQIYETSAQKPAPADLVDTIQRTTAANLPAYRAVITPTNTEFTLLIPCKDRVYVIAPVHDLAATSVDPQALNLFNQVVATFSVDLS